MLLPYFDDISPQQLGCFNEIMSCKNSNGHERERRKISNPPLFCGSWKLIGAGNLGINRGRGGGRKSSVKASIFQQP